MIAVLLVFCAAVFNACMDVLRYRYKNSIFRFWKNQNWINPALSWPNKWKLTSKIGDLIMSIVLVWLTDFWHLCKLLMLVSFSCAIVFYEPMFYWYLDVFIYVFLFGGTFELFWSVILIKKEK